MKTDLHTTAQTGSVRKKGNQWYYRFSMINTDGEWKLREFKGGKNKRETERMLKEALNDYLDKGYIIDSHNITVNELAEQWYHDEIEYSNLAANTKYDYYQKMDHIRKAPLGNTKIKNVTIEQLQAFMDMKTFGVYDDDGNELEQPYSASMVKRIYQVLNGMFKYAVYPKQYLRENPMQYVKKRKKPQPISLFEDDEDYLEENKTISLEEYNHLIQVLENDPDNWIYVLPIQIAYFTGLRAGEICGLTWDDINLEEQYLTVRRSMYYDKNNKCWQLKTAKSKKKREVDFGNQLTRILCKAKMKQQENQLHYGTLYEKHYLQIKMIKGIQNFQIFTQIHPDIKVLSSRKTKGKFMDEIDRDKPMRELHFVCPKQDGEMITTQSLKSCNKIVQRKIPELDFFHFHLLRHTYGSNLVQNGANFKDVQILMGHSDISITLNIYAHVSRKSKRAAVDILERATQIM